MGAYHVDHRADEDIPEPVPAGSAELFRCNLSAEAAGQAEVLQRDAFHWDSKLLQFFFGTVDGKPAAVRNGQGLLKKVPHVTGMLEKAIGVKISLPAMNLFSSGAPSVVADTAFILGLPDEPIHQILKGFLFLGFHTEIRINRAPRVLNRHDFLLFALNFIIPATGSTCPIANIFSINSQ
jgi:hypothetical protein